MRRLLFLFILVSLSLGVPLASAETRSGTIQVVVADDFAREETATAYRLKAEGESVPLLPTSLSSAESGDWVSVTGRMEDGHLVGAVQELADTSQDSEGNVVKVAVVEIKFGPGEEKNKPTPQQWREALFTDSDSVKAFYEEESYGQISLTAIRREDGDVFGPYQVKTHENRCSVGLWQEEAQAAAAAEGISLEEYDHVIFTIGWYPPPIICNWSGLAETPGRNIDINLLASQADAMKPVLGHELGHNLGLPHAGNLLCTNARKERVPFMFAGTCEKNEYGDWNDVMGQTYRPSHGWYLNRLGILAPSNVQTIDRSGVYTLHAALNPTTQTTVLRVPREWSAAGVPIEWYDFEIRAGTSMFEIPWHGPSRGVTVHTSPPGSASSLEIPAADEVVSGSSQIMPGHTFTDGGVSVTTLAAGEGQATVDVELHPVFASDTTPPSAPGTPWETILQSGVRLEWAASVDDVAVSSYLIHRDGSLIGTSAVNSFVDSSTTTPGPHVYTIYAEDQAGNRSPMSGATVVTVPDRNPPSAPGRPSASVTPLGINLKWKASTDNVAVTKYTIYRDRRAIGTSPTATFTDSADLTLGPHSYTVYASDASGNLSYASVQAIVEVSDRRSPSAPDALRASVLPIGVWLKWAASSDDVGVSEYAIYRDDVKIATTAHPGFLDTSAPPGQYSYAVYAEDAAGNQSDSSTRALASVGPSGFSPPESPGAAQGPVVMCAQSQSQFQAPQHSASSSGIDWKGLSGISSLSAAGAPDLTAPSAPGGLRAIMLAAGVWLEWEPSEDDGGVSGYLVYRDDTKVGVSSEAGFLDTGAPPGQHSYTVYAEDTAGNQSVSSLDLVVRTAATEALPPTVASSATGGARGACTPVSRPTLRLSWRRNRRGAVTIRVRAVGDPQVVRLELSVDGRRRAASDGPGLRYRWTPLNPRRSTHRIVVRALAASGEETALTRILKLGKAD